jgi:hypothetical protein
MYTLSLWHMQQTIFSNEEVWGLIKARPGIIPVRANPLSARAKGRGRNGA